jgi:hypothetical protein
LDRPGQGFTAVVEIHSEARPLREYWLSSQAEGKEVERKIVALAGIFSKPPFVGRVTFTQPFDELILLASADLKVLLRGCAPEGFSSGTGS